MKIKTLLIANRGEIACRIARTARASGITPVGIHSQADANALHVREIGKSVCIGGGPASESYLKIDAVIAAAQSVGADAIHPGYGFLAENPDFARAVEAAGMIFMGPTPETLERFGDKASAKEAAVAASVPVISGAEGARSDPEQIAEEVRQMGLPVLLKAVSGGGGRGMRIVREATDLEASFDAASAEAVGAFGDGRLYMEKLIENGRHIEFQVVGDARRAQVLGERECSIQRRHQKLLEETPSPGLSSQRGAEERAAVSELVIRACEAMDYRGAGTIEMLMDGDGNLYFMEMNTRLQVEHTITEEVTGEDLVQRQLEVAANVFLPDLHRPEGASIQCRINAEDTGQGFQPTPGVLTRFDIPVGEGIRVDTHLQAGDKISPHYDSMIAKVIVTAPTRVGAIQRMRDALDALVIEGVPTTAPLLRRLLDLPQFMDGSTDTGLLERHLEDLLA